MDLVPKEILPAIHGYWDRPPFKEQGDQDVNDLFRAVGESLATWENVEHVVAQIFGIFVDSRSSAAIRAYGAIASHNGRREALETASVIYFSEHQEIPEAKKYFDLLVSHLSRAAGRRNEIAHSTTMHFTVNNTQRGFFSVPAMYNSRKRLPSFAAFQNLETSDSFAIFGMAYRYTADDIKFFLGRFQQLQRAAMELLVFLLGRGYSGAVTPHAAK